MNLNVQLVKVMNLVSDLFPGRDTDPRLEEDTIQFQPTMPDESFTAKWNGDQAKLMRAEPIFNKMGGVGFNVIWPEEEGQYGFVLVPR